MFLGRDMKRLVGFINKDVALEPELQLVKDSVHRVIEKSLEGVRDLDTRGWNEIRFWLRSHQRDKPDGKPFRKYYVKTKDYANVLSTIESRNRANFWKSRSLIGCQFSPRKKMRPISGCDGSNFWVYNVIKICGFWRVEEKKVRKRQIQI